MVECYLDAFVCIFTCKISFIKKKLSGKPQLLTTGITETQNKKAIGYIGKQGELYESSKTLKNFVIIFIKADQQYILKFCFIIFWRNTDCLKNPAYNQVILKMILTLSRFFAKKILFFV